MELLEGKVGRQPVLPVPMIPSQRCSTDGAKANWLKAQQHALTVPIPPFSRPLRNHFINAWSNHIITSLPSTPNHPYRTIPSTLLKGSSRSSFIIFLSAADAGCC